MSYGLASGIRLDLFTLGLLLVRLQISLVFIHKPVAVFVGVPFLILATQLLSISFTERI